MFKKKYVFMSVAIVLMLVLAACGGGDDPAESTGPVAAGQALFSQSIIGAQPGCATCHSLTPDEVLVGPSLAGVGSRAGSQIPDMSAEDYLRESILTPDAFVVDGFPPSVMVQVWADELSDAQVDSLVAYLLTLK